MERGTLARDEWGIPHLWGETVEDLAYAQGYAAVVDRAWQIQVEKWRSEGRLAERLGATEVPWDRFARRAQLDDTARRCFQRLRPETQRWVESYVTGVNAALQRVDAAEFAAAGCQADPWHPWSPLGVFLVQHVLFSTFPNKLWHAHVAATLGPDAVELFTVEGPNSAGSNAWAIAGDPATGRPATIAGDPHRVLELPGIYQQVRLSCPEFDVIGLAFPGIPGLPHFGHAGSVAWAITHAMADYQDLYREQLRRVHNRVEVREPQGWSIAASRVEHIAVRGGEPVTVEVVETPRGPVIDFDRATGEALSLRTPSWVERDLGFDCLLPLLRARCVDDVVAALRGWVEPVNSVLTADRTGTVRSFTAGLVPIRDPRCRREPVPAWEPRYQWQGGYVRLPEPTTPEMVVNANDRRTDVAGIGADFAPPHRARRIRTLLAHRTPDPAIHTDTFVANLTLRSLLARLDRLSVDAARLRDRLSAWDGHMDAHSGEAAAFAAWRSALARRLADHPCLRPLQTSRPFDELFAPWTDPRARIGIALDGVVAGLHRIGGMVEPIAAAALEDVAAGPDPGTWGQRHVLHPVPPPGPPGTQCVAALPTRVPLSGDTNAVLATSSVAGVSDACWRGPVARYIWDLGDRANSRWIVPFGASGNPNDPHFADQLPLWATGQLIPVPAGPPAPRKEINDLMVYEEQLPALGQLTLTVLDPQRDIPLVHSWVTQPRAKFWGMLNHSVDDVREIYQYIDGLDTHHAYLIRLDQRPIGLFQSYQPDADPVGERYPVQSGDIGMHLLLAPGPRPPRGLTTAVVPALFRFLFRDPAVQRIVAEPDVRNHFALQRARRSGFILGDEIDLPEKRAQLAFLTRERFQELFQPAWSDQPGADPPRSPKPVNEPAST
jgi:penicillin amidase